MSLTARAITFAQECGLFNLIHVSTDDEEIAAEAERFDSPVVFFRSSSTSSDSSSSTDAICEVHQIFASKSMKFS